MKIYGNNRVYGRVLEIVLYFLYKRCYNQQENRKKKENDMINLEENNLKFYFNKNKLIENYNKFSKDGDIYYPLKTNSNENLIKALSTLLNKANNGYLISSLYHFELLKKLGISPSRMCFINVLVEKETIRYLYDNGVRFFTFDCLKSLEEFVEYANLREVKIAIRLSTMQIYKDKFTHLGAELEETLRMIEFLKRNGNSNYGISFYIQKNIKTENNVFENILQYIQEKYSDSNLKFISIGGINTEINHKVLDDLKTKLKIEQIILEVGRYLVEDTIELETRIIRDKMIRNTKTIVIKNGIYSGFFDILLYNKRFQLYLKTENNEEIKFEYEKSQTADYEVYICGGSSDSGDKIGIMYIDSAYKNELITGRKIIIKDVGAYFEEFFMPYSKDLRKVYIDKK